MGKIITLFAVMFFALVGISAGAAQLSVEIESVFEYRHPSLYDMEDQFDDPVLFVFEYSVFSGPNAEKMASAFTEEGDDAKKMMKRFDRKKSNYSYEDYVVELSNVPDQHFDITTCFVTYDKNGVLSMARRLDWYIGAVHDIVFKCHTFCTDTGRELEITDVLKGTKESILKMLTKEFEAQYDELLKAPRYPVDFYLSEEGVVYVPASDIIYGYQRGCVLLIPYSRADLVKAAFAMRP